MLEKGELIRVNGDNSKNVVAEELYAKVSTLLKNAKGFVS